MDRALEAEYKFMEDVTNIADEGCSRLMSQILTQAVGHRLPDDDEKAVQQIRRGAFKKRVRICFEVDTLADMYIPQQSVVAEALNSYFYTILLYQNQANSHLFELYLSRNEYCRSTELDACAKEFVYSLIGGKPKASRIIYYKVLAKAGRAYPDDIVRKQMLIATGYNIARQVLDIYIVDAKSSAYHAMGNSKASGRIFDVAEFQRQILKAVENILFFTQHPLIRILRIESNKAKQRACLRMLDHRPLVQDVWNQGVKFVLQKHPSLQPITQEQFSALFSANYQSVMALFNSLVMGDSSFIVQPHPIRALLDHLPYLMQTNCFDLSMYSLEGATLNYLVSSYFIGRNFFTSDEHMSNTQGAICFAGAPGSGKSHIVAILYEFINGFNYQDTPKGMTEFQNYDIVTKAFIKCEEVYTKRLAQPDWKMLADIQVALKCKIKNQQDVEVTKNVPVVITTNDDVFQAIIDRAMRGDANYQAVHRRWAFVRYFYSWREKHSELFEFNGLLKREYVDIYQGAHTGKSLMNSLVASSLLFGNIYQAMPDYILPYYAHCLQQFAMTMFGSFALKQRQFVVETCKYLGLDVYLSAAQVVAKAELTGLSQSMENAFVKHWVVLLREQGLQEQLNILQNVTLPLYQRCVLLGFDSAVIKVLTAQHRLALLTFLTSPENHHLDKLYNFMYPADTLELEMVESIVEPMQEISNSLCQMMMMPANTMNPEESSLVSPMDDWSVKFTQLQQ